MTRSVWRTKIATKSFYVRTYRRICNWILISLLTSIVLSVAISYLFIHQPERQYYATNGITAPVQLTPLDAANKSSNALLQPDPVIPGQTKLIPE